MRGGEWCFKNHVSRKMFAEIHGCRSLDFLSGYARLALSIFFFFFFLHKPVSQNRLFKAKKAAKYRFVYMLYMNLNNVGTGQARI